MEYCKPVRLDLFKNLSVDEFKAVLQQFFASGETLSNIPPVLPKEGELYIFVNYVAGLTLYKNAHFTTVVFWHGSQYFYDSLKSSDAMR